MSEDLRRLAQFLVEGKTVDDWDAIVELAADYLRSLDEGERLRERLKRIKQRAENVPTVDVPRGEEFDAALTEIVHLAALSPQEPSDG